MASGLPIRSKDQIDQNATASQVARTVANCSKEVDQRLATSNTSPGLKFAAHATLELLAPLDADSGHTVEAVSALNNGYK